MASYFIIVTIEITCKYCQQVEPVRGIVLGEGGILLPLAIAHMFELVTRD
ncbi:hypothetical protein KKI90_08535 [Xenorhabdus bovienii]|nr:hypothetical protein [Xenorhabdus bovienii]MDE1486311.1 hypothetical protein [Xenorhabdus bovienii]MDE9455768.1 hypothetical protein [Xenorhabdus bovienii]MDE9477113.1 hypothetical protein [Xenorhabdus bovienii]